jgi:hypothetical protein
MKGEINRDFYCSYYCSENKDLPMSCIDGRGCLIGGDVTGKCKQCHRKWPTLEQYREEYSRLYRNCDPVFIHPLEIGGTGDDWEVWSLADVIAINRIAPLKNYETIICACTPFGKPDKDWRP